MSQKDIEIILPPAVIEPDGFIQSLPQPDNSVNDTGEPGGTSLLDHIRSVEAQRRLPPSLGEKGVFPADTARIEIYPIYNYSSSVNPLRRGR